MGSEIIPVPAMKRGSVGSEIIPVPDMERAGGGGEREGNVCPPADLPSPLLSLLPPPTPSRATGMKPPPPPPGCGRGRGKVGGEEGSGESHLGHSN